MFIWEIQQGFVFVLMTTVNSYKIQFAFGI